MGMFDALALPVNDSARLYLTNPYTGEPLVDADGNKAWIDLLPADSEAGRQHQRAVANRRMRSRARKITADELEAEGVALLAALTVGWSLLTLDGGPLAVPFTTENARVAYQEISWLRQQVDVFTGDMGNFQPKTTETT